MVNAKHTCSVVKKGVRVVIERQGVDTTFVLVAEAVAVVVGAPSATHTQGVKLISVAVAIALRDGKASAIVNGSWAIANPTIVWDANAAVQVVANAVVVHV